MFFSLWVNFIYWVRLGLGIHAESMLKWSESVTHSLWPMGCSPPSSSVHRDSPGKNTGMGCLALLQEIFLTQGLNPSLLHWQVDSLPSQPRRSPHWCSLNWESLQRISPDNRLPIFSQASLGGLLVPGVRIVVPTTTERSAGHRRGWSLGAGPWWRLCTFHSGSPFCLQSGQRPTRIPDGAPAQAGPLMWPGSCSLGHVCFLGSGWLLLCPQAAPGQLHLPDTGMYLCPSIIWLPQHGSSSRVELFLI